MGRGGFDPHLPREERGALPFELPARRPPFDDALADSRPAGEFKAQLRGVVGRRRLGVPCRRVLVLPVRDPSGGTSGNARLALASLGRGRRACRVRFGPLNGLSSWTRHVARDRAERATYRGGFDRLTGGRRES